MANECLLLVLGPLLQNFAMQCKEQFNARTMNIYPVDSRQKGDPVNGLGHVLYCSGSRPGSCALQQNFVHCSSLCQNIRITDQISLYSIDIVVKYKYHCIIRHYAQHFVLVRHSDLCAYLQIYGADDANTNRLTEDSKTTRKLCFKQRIWDNLVREIGSWRHC